MDMTYDAYLFEHDTENGGLVRVHPTSMEIRNGRKMAATLVNMARDAKKNKQRSITTETSIGTLEAYFYMRGKKHFMKLVTPDGELSYRELRTFILLGIQYVCKEFPYLTVSYDGREAEIMLPSGRSIFDIVGVV